MEKERLRLESEKEEIELKISSVENRTKWVDWISDFGIKINKLQHCEL